MNVLVLAPHPDDEAIGCGGAMSLHAARGDRVTVAFLTSGELGLKHLSCEEARRIRQSEAHNAAKVLEVADVHFLRCPDWYLNETIADAAGLLQPVVDSEGPEVIYFPHPDESHPDHQAVAAILGAILKRCKTRPTKLYAYEIWTPLTEPNHSEDITKTMARKLRAVRCYRSQLPVFHYDRAVKGLNQYRGCLLARCRYAEAFRELAVGELVDGWTLGR
jgi:LmbE family N-acetylglucosaminyl deacetylase